MGELYKRASGVWYADYLDRTGLRVRKSTRVRDKQAASKILSKWEAEERLVEYGVKTEAPGAKSLATVLDSYDAAQTTAGDTPEHVLRTRQLIDAVSAHAGWTTLGDIDADSVNHFARHLKNDLGRSARTIGAMITAVRSFCRWCVKTGKLASDPTHSISKPKINNDRRIERRMVEPDEWKYLRLSLEQSTEVRNGQTSHERLVMYWVAIETGLRSGELRSLTKKQLHLTCHSPHVSVRASATKDSKPCQQYVSDRLAKELQAFVLQHANANKVFNVTSRNEMARTLRADVNDARKLWLADLEKTNESPDSKPDFLMSPDSAGHILDFHALRHTCGSWLMLQGLNIIEVQKIMRHSTIALTADRYGHLVKDARSNARNALSALI